MRMCRVIVFSSVGALLILLLLLFCVYLCAQTKWNNHNRSYENNHFALDNSLFPKKKTLTHSRRDQPIPPTELSSNERDPFEVILETLNHGVIDDNMILYERFFHCPPECQTEEIKDSLNTTLDEQNVYIKNLRSLLFEKKSFKGNSLENHHLFCGTLPVNILLLDAYRAIMEQKSREISENIEAVLHFFDLRKDIYGIDSFGLFIYSQKRFFIWLQATKFLERGSAEDIERIIHWYENYDVIEHLKLCIVDQKGRLKDSSYDFMRNNSWTFKMRRPKSYSTELVTRVLLPFDIDATDTLIDDILSNINVVEPDNMIQLRLVSGSICFPIKDESASLLANCICDAAKQQARTRLVLIANKIIRYHNEKQLFPQNVSDIMANVGTDHKGKSYCDNPLSENPLEYIANADGFILCFQGNLNNETVKIEWGPNKNCDSAGK